MLVKLEKLDRDLFLAFSEQEILRSVPELVNFLSDKCFFKTFMPGEHLTEQGAEDSGIYFLLSGEVKVLVNGAFVAIRQAGTQIGEIATMKPLGKRTATVIATKETKALFVDRDVYLDASAQFSSLSSFLALQAMGRLEQRGRLIVPPNEKPRIFIGSSKENLAMAQLIANGIPPDKYDVRIWTGGVFRHTRGVLEDLEREVDGSDFAIMVLGAEDKLKIRKRTGKAPRANVIFETGLFIGELKRQRVFIVSPNKFPIIPTDFNGVTFLTCDYRKSQAENAAPSFVQEVILKELLQQGARTGKTVYLTESSY